VSLVVARYKVMIVFSFDAWVVRGQ